MSLPTRAWITGARLRRRLRRGPAPDMREARRDWIRAHAPGRSFADVGGLFRLTGDVAFYAEEAGATDVTLFDAGDAALTDFPVKREERGSQVRFVQGDLEDPASIEAVGAHDIVWSIGVIYHSPNPVRQLMNLRELTRELLYLGTHTIPELPGAANACIYYPHLGERERAAYQAAHREPMAGLGAPFEDKPMLGHANFWWGLTGSALRAMLATARFEVVEQRHNVRAPFFTELVARPIARDPLLPPISYYREYGDRRAAGEQPPPFEDYYERRRSTAAERER